MTYGTNDLAPLLTPPPSQSLRYAQGVIHEWDPETFANEIEFRGVTLQNLPVLAGVDALGFRPGDVVGLLGWTSARGGMGSWWILGRITRTAGVAIRGGGSLEVFDEGAIIARWDNGTAGMLYGAQRTVETGEPAGFGLLIQRDDGDDVLRAKIDHNNDKVVYVGEDAAFADEFLIGADNISLVNTTGRGIGAKDGDVIINITRTTGASANLNLSESSGAGFLARSTSSLRYKQDIEDYRPAATILDLAPRTWRDKGEVEEQPDTSNRYVGLIAEEVDALGLSEYVTYDDQGRPDAVAYDRLAVGLLSVVRDLTEWAKSQGYDPPATPAAEPVKASARRGSRPSFSLPPSPPERTTR